MADLGRFKLVYWPVAEERISGNETEITFEAGLWGPRRGLPEMIVAVASRSPDAVVVELDRFTMLSKAGKTTQER